jgi:hypothetical protein
MVVAPMGYDVSDIYHAATIQDFFSSRFPTLNFGILIHNRYAEYERLYVSQQLNALLLATITHQYIQRRNDRAETRTHRYQPI